jgi:hypothetical protein
MASEKLKAVLQRELETHADRGMGLAELLDYLHASNRRFARRNKLSDEQLDELSLWCWVRARSSATAQVPVEPEPEPPAEPAMEPPDSLLERIEARVADPEPIIEAMPEPEVELVAAAAHDPIDELDQAIAEPAPEPSPDLPAQDLWAGFRRTPIPTRSRSRRLARSASAST